MEVPQIATKTGISQDYWTEYFAKAGFLQKGIESVAKIFEMFPIKKYEQRFSPEIYENVITEENRKRVARLNELADIANKSFRDISKFNEHQFKNHINEVYHLIYSRDEKFFSN